jgi:hypothetical protein
VVRDDEGGPRQAGAHHSALYANAAPVDNPQGSEAEPGRFFKMRFDKLVPHGGTLKPCPDTTPVSSKKCGACSGLARGDRIRNPSLSFLRERACPERSEGVFRVQRFLRRARDG